MIEIKNLADGSAEVFIYGEIGWEVNSGDFARELAGIEAEKITARIDSPGGDAYQGIAIMNALRGHPATVTAVIEGLAASAASFIAVGGADHVVIRPHAEVMVHDAMAFVGGNAEEMQRALADLDRISDNIAGIYADKAGGDPEGWREIMRAETWYSAEEAVAVGLADVVEDARQPVEARQRVGVFNLSKFKYPGRRAAPAPVNHAPPGQESKEADVADLKSLAQKLGIDEKTLLNFAKILNEEIGVTTTVEVTYPEGNTVVPTGKVVITPNGDVPSGITFTLGDVPEGWTAEVEETTGVLTVTAPSGVEPGDEVVFPITATGNADPVEFQVAVAVKAAAGDDEGGDGSTTPPAAPVGGPSAPETKTLDVDTYNELVAMAKLGAQAHRDKESADREAEVDKWISEGRINASLRAKAIKAMERDPETARAVYGSNPKNTIPRGEVGYGRQSEEDPKGPEAVALRERAAKANLFPKPNL